MMRKAEEEINNVSELINKLKIDTRDISGPFWYRGHRKKEYQLIPSLYRSDIREGIKEIDLLKQYKQDAEALVNPRPTKPYEWLFIMRQHGVPTRLLDWSESVLIATYFAIERLTDDGSLYVLLPIELNRQGGYHLSDPNSLPSFEEDEDMGAWSPKVGFETDRAQSNPIAFIYPRNIQRMIAQQSVFTIHHTLKTPIENIGDGNHVWKYIIPEESKPIFKQELELLGIDRVQVFPELEHIGKKIEKIAKKEE